MGDSVERLVEERGDRDWIVEVGDDGDRRRGDFSFSFVLGI